MAIGAVGAFGAKGATDELKELLARRFAEDQAQKAEAARQQQFQFQQRNADLDNARADAGLALQREKFGADQAASAAEGASREAQLVQLRAIADDPKTPEVVRQRVRLFTSGVSNPSQFVPDDPKPTEPTVRGGMLGTDGKPQTWGIDPQTGRPVWQQPEYERPPTPQSMLPIVMMGPDGPIGVNRQTMTAQPVTQGSTGQPVGKAANGAEATTLSGFDTSIKLLEDLKSLKKDEWLGPVQGRLTQAQMKLPLQTIPKELASFGAKSSSIKNSIIQAITGAGVGIQEAQRIADEIPLFEDNPTVWEQKLESVMQNIKNKRDETLRLTGVRMPGGAQSPAQPKASTGRYDPATGTVIR